MSLREIRNVKITKTFLGPEDHGIFTCFVHTMAKSAGQGFGGHGLDYKAYGIEYIKRILDAVGVEAWEKLPGVNCRIDADYSKVYGIGHIIEDKWFYPEEDLK